MSEFMTRFFRDEERTSNVVIWGAAVVVAFAFVGALAAMLFLK